MELFHLKQPKNETLLVKWAGAYLFKCTVQNHITILNIL